MKNSMFSKKGILFISLSVATTIAVCLFVCSMYVKQNHAKYDVQQKSQTIVQVME